MFNARDIIRNNFDTFYDFDSRQKRSQKPRLILTALVALTASVLFTDASDNMLAGFLAVQSILLGFTFNVMFFLAGNKPTREVRATSIEGRLRADRLRILYRELFFNVSYFNFVAICSISVAVLLLLPSPAIPAFALQWAPVVDYVEWLGSSPLPPLMQAALKCFAMFTFYALVIEVIFSISRVIGRTSFYFEKKMGETPAVEPGES